MAATVMHNQQQALTALRDYPNVALGLAGVGALYAAISTLTFLRFFTQTFISPGRSLKKFGAKSGSWAVVTGATDGIGREFAAQLAKAGFNVFLASRTAAKLDALAQELESQYNVKTKTHAIDFGNRDVAAYDKLAASLSGVDVGVLVNNVGRSHDLPVYFDQTPAQEIDDILEINVHATLRVTQIVLPNMLAKKNGLILNIGSFAGAVPSPMLAVYSGSKAFLSAWSQALAEEYAGRGITVELVNTYFVVSSMSKIRRATLMVPTPKTYVKSVLSKIGVPCGATSNTTVSTPYWPHATLDWLIGLLPSKAWAISYSHNLHIDIRKRALRKREREAAAAAKAE